MGDYRSIEKNCPDLLNVLLKDMMTGRNIIWATNDYERFGEKYGALQEITRDLLIDERSNVIQPSNLKSAQHKKMRVREKAEIFTPSWLCNEQNNLIDEIWFGRANIFNKVVDEQKHIWQPTSEKIFFDDGRNWKTYVKANRLEVACGEAPYLVSRYDTVSGVTIPVENRIGLLDRKLRVVGENTSGVEDWLHWAKKSLQSVYAYEFQGDNLFIARCNIFFTVKEFFFKKYNFECDVYQNFLEEVAEIISWNLWQMDGLTNAIPYYEPPKKDFVQLSLFEPENVYCRIKDWQTDEVLEYRSLMKGA
ncbi:MAG: restriction endonuclease subunit M [Selenomonadaceae bacterium]|nr:restriction endonuclease subunit M [Selenomonadaceae bacterium]